ncbi:hypothetical protein ACFXG4_05055 [Nocardia sp. NPDC059246]|uniref:hypothetical protein n=1 Tax=unclassified Nocardia TaxID=2637762 RepID=UPI0036AEBB53
MTTPGIPAPDGAFVVGGKYGSDLNKETTQQQLAAGTIAAYTRAQNAVGSQVREPIVLAKGAADVALTQAQAAANDAANAVEKADIAYALATEWSLEFVAASAEVLLGANELLVGPMLNVRAGRLAIMTDVHIAFLEQHGGLTVETRKWNDMNTAYTVAHTGVIDPNVTRRNFSALTVNVLDEERFFPYITSITGTVPPTVLQICVAGVYIDA